MTTFHENFDRLLAAWRQHEEARESGAAISELAEARWSLDAARYATAASRPGWK